MTPSLPLEQILSDPAAHWRGIITVLNTPFTTENAIDLDGVTRHVAYALEAGVAGFLVPALAGEVFELSLTERRDIVASVAQSVRGRVPIIVGTAARDLETSVTAARDGLAAGADGILVNLAFTEEAAYREALQPFVDLDPPMIMIQDWDPSGTGIPAPFITQLFAEIPAFTSYKIEVTPAGPKYSEMLDRTQGRLHVAGGWAVTEMPDGLARGVHAFMPTGLHYTYTALHRLYGAGNMTAFTALWNELQPILKFSNQGLAISIHFFKHLLHAQRIFDTARVRTALDTVTDAVRDATPAMVQAALALEKRARDQVEQRAGQQSG
ncbi:MAG: dihydrodipicolinate synthase family protein [Candidatus Hydrogenedentes bacterium]|nr:dihydrodipicolinate synthase family protein [Candidatus Hydrogenedentota bacterium]